MTSEQILEEITSRNTHKVRNASFQIIALAKKRSEILPLIEHLSQIKEKTKGLEMGGALAPNQRFVDFAIRIIEFHKDSKKCTCELYLDYGFDPKKEVDKGYIKINTQTGENWAIDYYAECLKCGQRFKIIEREYHLTWWEWTKID